jgi:hypothetical protein
MEVDVKDRLATWFCVNYVVVPDFFDHRSRARHSFDFSVQEGASQAILPGDNFSAKDFAFLIGGRYTQSPYQNCTS